MNSPSSSPSRGDIAAEFCDLLTFLQNVSVCSLDIIVRPTHILALIEHPFFTSTFVPFFAHIALLLCGFRLPKSFPISPQIQAKIPKTDVILPILNGNGAFSGDFPQKRFRNPCFRDFSMSFSKAVYPVFCKDFYPQPKMKTALFQGDFPPWIAP